METSMQATVTGSGLYRLAQLGRTFVVFSAFALSLAAPTLSFAVDSDGDGVEDDQDQCPLLDYYGGRVDEIGCPVYIGRCPCWDDSTVPEAMELRPQQLANLFEEPWNTWNVARRVTLATPYQEGGLPDYTDNAITFAVLYDPPAVPGRVCVVATSDNYGNYTVVTQIESDMSYKEFIACNVILSRSYYLEWYTQGEP